MTLEDHVGDVIRKAREAGSIGTAEAATAAGLSPDVLDNLEKLGRVPPQVRWSDLARLLRLDPLKLERLALGWSPSEPDLSIWRELRRLTTTAEGMSVHNYVVWDEVTREAALFDAGWTAEPTLELLEQENLQLRHIFITHSHGDHLGGLEPIRSAFPKALLHTGSKHAPPQHRNRANDFIHLGSLRISNRETPGHAEDGVTYIVGNWPEDAPHVAMVGDAIFAGSMGRGNQSAELAREKVRDQILSLPLDTLICPGHGPFTTVREEKEHNPFF